MVHCELYLQRFFIHYRNHLERHHNPGAKSCQNLWKRCFWILLSLILVLGYLASLSTLCYWSSGCCEIIQLMLPQPRFFLPCIYFLQRHFWESWLLAGTDSVHFHLRYQERVTHNQVGTEWRNGKCCQVTKSCSRYLLRVSGVLALLSSAVLHFCCGWNLWL